MPPKLIAPSTITRGKNRKAFKVAAYGDEGVGKSEFASLCPGVIFADLELSTLDLDVARENPLSAITDYAAGWTLLRKWIQGLSGGVYVIDTMTRAEMWCAAFVTGTKKLDAEDVRFKSAHSFIANEFACLILDLDNAFRRGTSFILLSHSGVARIGNPDGANWSQHQPRLINSDRGSTLHQVCEFVDHILFLDIDTVVDKGKAKGSGTRTIYYDTNPARISKSRSLPAEQSGDAYERGKTWIWDYLLKQCGK